MREEIIKDNAKISKREGGTAVFRGKEYSLVLYDAEH